MWSPSDHMKQFVRPYVNIFLSDLSIFMWLSPTYQWRALCCEWHRQQCSLPKIHILICFLYGTAKKFCKRSKSNKYLNLISVQMLKEYFIDQSVSHNKDFDQRIYTAGKHSVNCLSHWFIFGICLTAFHIYIYQPEISCFFPPHATYNSFTWAIHTVHDNYILPSSAQAQA